MTRIYVLFSVVGWAWAVIVAAFLFFKLRSSKSHEEQH
jgi:hypothetical protein